MSVDPVTVEKNDLRLIEAGFPCHQVGAETQRERDTGKAPPTHRLHVWWARRPLTPSRAAILGSLLPADTDVDWFLRQLGIEQVQADVNGVRWVLTGKLRERIRENRTGEEVLVVDSVVRRALEKEQERRRKNRDVIAALGAADPSLARHPVVTQWSEESEAIPEPLPIEGMSLKVYCVAADPARTSARLEFKSLPEVQAVMPGFQWDSEALYGYGRAFEKPPSAPEYSVTVLDPTAGGGSIPFEALRLGHRVVANDINPVAAIILHATLDYPARFGAALAQQVENWGNRLNKSLDQRVNDLFPTGSQLDRSEKKVLENHLSNCLHLVPEYDLEHPIDYLYARQVTCPHCYGEAPLLNSCWLSKSSEKWGVRIVTNGHDRGGKVSFEPYRVGKGNRGPSGEDPNLATVTRGVGTCVHCKQAISADEIKAQARGESPHGKWQDRLYSVVSVRYQPKLDRKGLPQRYASGPRVGEIKTEKVQFFRAPNAQDLAALEEAERRLEERWPEWEAQGLIPTEAIPRGHKTAEPLRVGMTRWCDMFTPRQLLCHLIHLEELNRLKPEILKEHGLELGRAIVTYLQFVIDKCVDYNSKQTRWIPQRGTVSGTFGRHDFSVKWTFGEMVFAGSNSGAIWGLSQVIDAFNGITKLVESSPANLGNGNNLVINGSAASLELEDCSIDLICMDPPYYNNVQYAELSDYYYVWQRRTLSDLYPDIFQRRLTNKVDEAVANPARDGSSKAAEERYESSLQEILDECFRVLKPTGRMTLMFTHKSQEAWAALTRALIQARWIITSTLPVESEFEKSQNIAGNASAASSIFLTCRKRIVENSVPATWSGFGGTGVAQRVREAVREGLKEFEPLGLNPVDEMVASYGRALRVLSENWPVYDGDEMVSPVRAMNEASAVVAQYQMERITQGRLKVDDLESEAAMAVTLFGIFGLNQFPYDEALNLSRSLNIKLEGKPAGYGLQDGMIGINNELRGRRGSRLSDEEIGYHAPLLRSGSKLRLALPHERNSKRIEDPQTEWDSLHGAILAYREGDVPVARAYVERHAQGRAQVVHDLLSVWAAHVSDPDLRKEAEALLFGLR